MTDRFLLRLADRKATLELEQSKASKGQREIVNALIGQLQAIEYDYLTAKTDATRIKQRVARFAKSSKSEIVIKQGEGEAKETAKRLTRRGVRAVAEKRDGTWFVRKVEER